MSSLIKIGLIRFVKLFVKNKATFGIQKNNWIYNLWLTQFVSVVLNSINQKFYEEQGKYKTKNDFKIEG